MKNYPFELIAAYNDIEDNIVELNKNRQNLLCAICSMCKQTADKCDNCIRLCNFEPKD